MPEQVTFRLRKGVLILGIACAALFTAAMMGHACLFLLEEPEKHGFKGEHSITIAAWMGIALYGTMCLLSLYTVLGYYAEHFAIHGSTVVVKSVFQNREFDQSEIQRISWRVYPAGGSLWFTVLGRIAHLDLYGFSREDRLRIVEIAHDLVPLEKQEGWELFCHKIALPLRDGKTLNSRVEPNAKMVTIGRSRYDRFLVIALPISLIVAFALFQSLGLWQFIVLPIGVVAAWLLLRFSVPKDGMKSAKLTSTHRGRVALLGYGSVCGATLLQVAIVSMGVEKKVACSVGCVLLLVALVPILVMAYKADKISKQVEQQGAELADEIWRTRPAETVPGAIK